MSVDEAHPPKGWVWTYLEDVGKISSGGTPSTKRNDFFDGDVPWITPADLSGFKGKKIARGARNITKSGLNSSSARLLPKGTILFSSRAPIGYVAIADAEMCTNQGFKNITPSDGVASDFLFWYLKGSKKLAEANASGTTFLEISAKRFAKLPFPLPPSNEQRRIVLKLEELFTRIDAGTKELENARIQLKRYRQAVLKSAFEGKLTEEWRKKNNGKAESASVLLERLKKNYKGKPMRELDTSELPKLPESWCWTTLERFTDITLGQSPPSSTYNTR